MTLKTQMAADMPTFSNDDEFSEEIGYTAAGESLATIDAIVDRSGAQLEEYVRGPVTAIITISVKKVDVPNKAYGDTFTIDGNVWNFEPTSGVIYEDDNVVQISLERDMP